jgi:hypothetical protein
MLVFDRVRGASLMFRTRIRQEDAVWPDWMNEPEFIWTWRLKRRAVASPTAATTR